MNNSTPDHTDGSNDEPRKGLTISISETGCLVSIVVIVLSVIVFRGEPDLLDGLVRSLTQ